MEMNGGFSLSWLTDPNVFQVNRLEPHSDHKIIDEKGRDVKPLYLNGQWNFKYYDNLEEVDFSFIHDKNLCVDSITVPGHIQLQGYGKPQYVNTMYPWDGHEKIIAPEIPQKFNPVGIYSTEFDLPEDYIHKGVRISFQGVESCFYLWLNGQFIGYSENTFCPAEFDLTHAVKNKGNYISVMVVRFCSGSWLEDQDFWRFSGIFRDVYLYSVTSVFIEDVELQPLLNDNFDKGTLKAKVKLACKEEKRVKLRLLLGLKETFLEVNTEGNTEEGGNIELSATIIKPLLWSAEEPNLYQVKVIAEAAETGEFITGARADIGFRRFEMKDKIMCLNGKRIVFRGINRHEFHYKKGRAVDVEDIEKDIKLIKRNNFNAIRTSHYPNSTEFYGLCDKYGLYVIDETNLETHGTWMVMGKVCNGENVVPGDKVQWQGAVLDRGRAMVEREKNHPSILMWSCGNESHGGSVIKNLSEWFRSRDPYRLVHYEGIFFDRRFNETSDVESRMYTKSQDIENYLKNHPQKPFILCEYAHAMGNSFGGVQKYTELEEKYPMYQGGFIWDFKDQGLLTETEDGRRYLAVGGDFEDRSNDRYFCGNGLFFADGTPTPKLQEAKVLYSPVKIQCEENKITVKNRNLFKDTSDYEFLWCIKNNGKILQQGTFHLCVEPQESKTVELNLEKITSEGETILQCSMVQKEDTLWAEKGFEVAFGQGISKAYEFLKPGEMPAQVIHGDCNIGIKMASSFAMISKSSGKLISLKSNKSELIKVPLSPDFWRAPTDNDLGNMSNFHWAQWKLASLYQQCEKIEVDEKNSIVTAYFIMPTNPVTRCKVSYTFYEADTIKVDMSLSEAMGDVPCAGLTFKMPQKFKKLQWYGNSQEEAYCDRENGSRIDLCEGNVREQYVPYLNPQECGNKTQLRYFTLIDEDGNGLKITSNKPFEASALPYTSHEIEEASNILHLPPSNNEVVVSAYAAKCGVGGDDSWGALVHDEYLVSLEKGINFTLYLSVFNEKEQ